MKTSSKFWILSGVCIIILLVGFYGIIVNNPNSKISMMINPMTFWVFIIATAAGLSLVSLATYYEVNEECERRVAAAIAAAKG